MTKRPSLNFTDDWFIQRGYTRTENGGWEPPKFKNPLRKNVSDGLETKPIIKSIDFKSGPTTEWHIPVQVPSKKNSRINFVTKAGKQLSIPSKRHKDYVAATKMYWTVFGKEFRDAIEELKLSFPVNVQMTFIRSTNQIVDYFGPGETVFDLMTDFGWWPDDSSRYGKPFFGDMEVDKANVGVRIKLLV